jgi:hypothetical protein
MVIVLLLTSRSAVFGNSKSPAVDIATKANVMTQGAALPLAPTTSSNTMPSDPPPQQWTVGKKGPWGQIESLLFALDVPDECVAASALPPVRWSFPAYGKEKVLATLRTVGVSEAEVNRLKSSAKWSSDDGVTSVEPGDPLILRLAPEVRAKLYAILSGFPQNARQIDPVCFRPGSVDWRLQDSGLAPESVALLKRMLYPQGENTLMFADFTPALRSLSSDAERSRFMKVVSRKQAVLARVRLAPDSDVEKLAEYWGIGGRRKDIFPILNSLHRIDKGFSLSVICLLPEFARNRLYRHPCTVPDDKSVPQDCFWSAYNFFNDPPDNSVENTHSVVQLNREYDRISNPSQLGDLMILTTRDGVPFHAAVYLADDIYFTKNGVSITQPWILMHLADLLDDYSAAHPGNGLVVHYFRRKGF